jgi:hypothetical protein
MRIFDRLKAGDINGLKEDSVDLVGMCYAALGQKPDKQQMLGMAQLLYYDLINYHTNLTMEEIKFAFDIGLRNPEQGTSAFVNVRTWSVWINDYKQNEIRMRGQNRLTAFQLHKQGQKAIAETINKAKRLK